MLQKDPMNLIVTGVGGQGNVLASQLVGSALVGKDYFVTIGETYGASQRGGPVMSHIRVSKKGQCGPLIPEGKSDIILGLEPMETMRVMGQYGNAAVLVAANTRPIYPLDVTVGNAKYPSLNVLQARIKELAKRAYFLDATEMAVNLGASILTNIIMVGALVGLEAMPLTKEDAVKILRKTFKAQKLEINLKALQMGIDSVKNA